jgi:hypothetical protein
MEAVSLTPGDSNPISHSRKISRALAVVPQLATDASTHFALFGVEPVRAPFLKHDSSGEMASLTIRLKRTLEELAPTE